MKPAPPVRFASRAIALSRRLALVLAVLLCPSSRPAARAAEPGDLVVVVFNKALPESKKIAEHYAAARKVPARNVIGLDLPVTEEITRGEYKKRLHAPLFERFLDNKWIELNTARRPKPLPANFRPILGGKVRYIVLCHGVPLKITEDPTLTEPEVAAKQPELRRNGAAVDNELALLPISREKTLLSGPLPNPFYGATNPAVFNLTNGLILVSRLDGPTPEIALRLVDKVMQSETNGFWGRAYFDLRGITNGEYKIGDDWIRGGAFVARGTGFETMLDAMPATYPTAFPMSHIAIYAGWYEGNVCGPFARPQVEFMPGAFAYHLHSFNAATLRSTNRHWAGPLLARGASLTFGSVDEPYLSGTPNVAIFLERLLWNRFTFGEAAYAAQSVLSWQTTVIGDPLFRPMAEPPDALHFRLEAATNSCVEWSHLRVVNLNLARNASAPDELLKYVEDVPLTRASAVLLEKRGDILRAQGRQALAVESYKLALDQRASPQQKVRLLLTIAQMQGLLNRDADAFAAYERLVTECPDYPDLAQIHTRLVTLGKSLGKTNEVERYQKLIEKPGTN
jgi:uncharacterized protein (TIGR03790 family)